MRDDIPYTTTPGADRQLFGPPPFKRRTLAIDDPNTRNCKKMKISPFLRVSTIAVDHVRYLKQ